MVTKRAIKIRNRTREGMAEDFFEIVKTAHAVLATPTTLRTAPGRQGRCGPVRGLEDEHHRISRISVVRPVKRDVRERPVAGLPVH
jgi:hypothetical protein